MIFLCAILAIHAKQMNSSLYYAPKKCSICIYIRRYITIILNSKKFTLCAVNKCTMCTGSIVPLYLQIKNQSYFPVFPGKYRYFPPSWEIWVFPVFLPTLTERCLLWSTILADRKSKMVLLKVCTFYVDQKWKNIHHYRKMFKKDKMGNCFWQTTNLIKIKLYMYSF